MTKLGVAVLGILFVFLWWVIPVRKRDAADRYVDRLCKVDGGIVVYEQAPRLNLEMTSAGYPLVPFEGQASKAEPYFYRWTNTDLIGSLSSNRVAELVVWRSALGLYRSSDARLLGVAVSYYRRGGDPVGPWHFSSYGCPSDANEHELARRVLTQ